MTYAKLLAGILIAFFALFAASQSVSAYYGYGYPAYSDGMMNMMGGYPAYFGGAYNGYGYPAYSAGPYSYQFVPHSFWGQYINPNYYYGALGYSTRNILMESQQQDLWATYDFMSGSDNYLS